MKRTGKLWAVLAAGVLLLAGCEETNSSKQTKVQPPAATPAPTPVPSALHEKLPLRKHPVYITELQPAPRPALDILLERVQARFAAAQKEYAAAQLDESRADFERAEDLILTSGFQLDYDPRLMALFEKIGETMESYELNAAKGADQEPENAEQPAPIDEIADLTLPAADPRLVLKAEKELLKVPHDLPLTVNESVLQYLSFFTTTRGRAVVEHGLERAGRYDAMIRQVLREQGVPEDMIYLAQAESAFQPQAVSRSGARGIWQFMPFRGEEYDLGRSYWVDERSDPEKATRAAARHFRDLYNMFGDWYLVMAAYNSGPLNVVRAIERTGYADFWELQKRNALPKETRNYVPIILAMALVAKDPALYGVQVHPEKPASADTVKLDHSINLLLVADATGADINDLRLMNPELLRNITPGNPGFELHVPAGTGDKLQENIQQIPEEKWTSWRLHIVEKGETLSDVARRYRVTIAAIETVNHLQANATLPSGFLLSVPAAPPPVARIVRYRVRRGDTLEGIADRFDVTVAQLKNWNHIRTNTAPRGASLRIFSGGEPAEISGAKSKPAPKHPLAAHNAPAPKSDAGDPVHHRVKPGETLYSIAHAYKTTVSALRQSNPFLSARSLEAGDMLTIQR